MEDKNRVDSLANAELVNRGVYATCHSLVRWWSLLCTVMNMPSMCKDAYAASHSLVL